MNHSVASIHKRKPRLDLEVRQRYVCAENSVHSFLHDVLRNAFGESEVDQSHEQEQP
jgi:hypothetical protein